MHITAPRLCKARKPCLQNIQQYRKEKKLCHHGTTTAKLQQTTYPKLPKNNVTSHAHQIL